MKKNKFFLLFFISTILNANNIKKSDFTIDYATALKLYKQNKYKEAFPEILHEAKKGNKEAQYLIAHIYENGCGVKKDIKKAFYWYKKAANEYSYIVKKTENREDSVQYDKALQFAYSKIDTTSSEVKKEVEKLVKKDFGILPFHSNYVLPVSYSPTEKETDIEFQISIQKLLSYNFLGFNEYFSFGYTQKSFWNAYAYSSPFRETNYIPEFFVTLPTPGKIDNSSNLKAIQFGIRHHSNGQGGERSRSWNRLVLTTLWQWENLFLKAEAWYRIPENEEDDDNPDIYKYYGYGKIKLKYLYNNDLYTLNLRNNLRSKNKGSIEFNYFTPVYNSETTYWFFKLFNGYGESLIDYDKSITRIGAGIAFYRDIF